MIKIEKGVPHKKINHNRGAIGVALSAMSVDDSFLVGDFNETSIRRAAWYLKIKVSITADSEGKRRCWRTA